MSTARAARTTPDAHDFPTRPYDLVKEFVIALAVVSLLTVILAAVFSSPDERAVSLKTWATAAPGDVVATAAGELAGTTTSATYGPPYNSASTGQKLGPLSLQKWAGVRQPLDSANDLVVKPLETVRGNLPLKLALAVWRTASSSAAHLLGHGVRRRAHQGRRRPLEGGLRQLRAGAGDGRELRLVGAHRWPGADPEHPELLHR